MTDLVERLRYMADAGVPVISTKLMREAADEIERLRPIEAEAREELNRVNAENERLRLQWTGMKSEVQICHENIKRLRAEQGGVAMAAEQHGRIDESRRARIDHWRDRTFKADAEIKRLRACNERLGPWMSAALDDPGICRAMKADILAWFGESVEKTDD